MRQLTPATVTVVETTTDVEAPLYAVEAAAIAKAVDKRRREYTTVRWCARQALTRLGAPAGPIVSQRQGGPRWPAGLVGSLTHCTGYRAAAVARATDLSAIGIDAEPYERLPDSIEETVLSPGEVAWIERRQDDIHWGRVLFSIKEAIFKAWNPLTLQWLDFHDVEVRCAPEGTFGVEFTAPRTLPCPAASFPGITGRWAVRENLILSVATIAQLGDAEARKGA